MRGTVARGVILLAAASAWATGPELREPVQLKAGNASLVLTPPPPQGTWDLSTKGGIAIRLRNAGRAAVMVRGRVENADATGLMDASQNAVELLSGEEKTLFVRLTRRPEDPGYKVFEPFYMYYKGLNVRDNTVDAGKIAKVEVSLARGSEDGDVEVVSVEAIGEGKAGVVPFFPFIDKYGQYVHSDWPGKIYSDHDFAERVKEEARERADWVKSPEWNEYGGWKDGPTLEGTGWFRVVKHEGKWWFVDPVGKLYWSYGPTGVGYGGDVTPFTERESWFAELPAEGAFLRNGRGATYRYYEKREWRGLDIQRLNLMRKYGADYEAKVADVSNARLYSWGFNSIGNWSAPQVYGMHRTPYVAPIGAGTPTFHYRFQDVYDPAWEPAMRAAMERQRGTAAGDPWCIGFFVDNERWFGWRPRAAAIGEEMMKNPPERHGKIKMVGMLQQKYGEVAKLNEAWKTAFESWDALLASRGQLDMKNEAILSDCGDFGMMFAERYASVSREVVKRVAPNQLFLGSRLFGHTDPQVVKLLAKYWDVISYNIYDNPPTGRVNQYKALDVPILSTEWGIESDPTQTPFRNEKMEAKTPEQRAAGMVRYFEAAIRHPNIVGAHFFQFRDQPLSGRPDGEATLRGFVNVADTPNFELVQANRRVAYSMYKTRAEAK